jgi:hypothetical protein
MRKIAAVALSLFLTCGPAFADDTPKDGDPQPAQTAKKKTTKPPAKSATAVLAEQVEAQQQQIQQLKDALAQRDAAIGDAKSAAAAADAKATEADAKVATVAASTAEVKTTTTTLSSDVADLKLGNDALKGAVQDTQKKIVAGESPSTIHFKGISITPGGFLAAESVTRTRALSADVNTPFTTVPFGAVDLAHATESNFSARQSRLSLLAETKLGSATIGGYYEVDFLSAGTTSNSRQSNSYTWRTRQAFAQASWENGWIVTGGQMWSMATENRKGIFNRQESTPGLIDAQYNVGYTWARQYGFRVVKDFGGKFALGFSVEEPQATIGGRGFSSVTTINSAAAPATIVTSGATTATTGNFFLNAPGASGGLYNAFDATGYTVNKAPDLIFKAAADSSFGHYELFGIVSFFRDRIYPCGVVGTNAKDTLVPAAPTNLTGTCASATPTVVSSFGATNSNTTGGGVGASALWTAFNKNIEFGVKAVGGDGIGRYGSAQLADATARPDGSLALIRTGHALGRVEWHVTPKFLVYSYYGAEYAWRAGYKGYNAVTVTKTAAIPATPPTAANPLGTPTIPATTTTTFSLNGIGGYGNVAANNSGCATEGVPLNDFNPSNGANCAGDIRIIQEGTLGFWYRFYGGPKGRIQFGVQYSYLGKNAWSGTGGVPAGGLAIGSKANDNMIFTSMRYYIP